MSEGEFSVFSVGHTNRISLIMQQNLMSQRHPIGFLWSLCNIAGVTGVHRDVFVHGLRHTCDFETVLESSLTFRKISCMV